MGAAMLDVESLDMDLKTKDLEKYRNFWSLYTRLITFVSSLQNAYCSVTLFLAFFLTFKRVTNIDLAYTSGSLVFMLMEI